MPSCSGWKSQPDVVTSKTKLCVQFELFNLLIYLSGNWARIGVSMPDRFRYTFRLIASDEFRRTLLDSFYWAKRLND